MPEDETLPSSFVREVVPIQFERTSKSCFLRWPKTATSFSLVRSTKRAIYYK